MHYKFIIAFRAKPPQEFRRKELDGLIENITSLMNVNQEHTYHIYVIEQGENGQLWNRGWLLNVGFLESSKDETEDTIYVHCNTDYRIPIEKFPQEFVNVKVDEFIDIHGYANLTLGGLCFFRSSTYKKTNGFRNDVDGWGGEDWGIYKRATLQGISIIRPQHLYNTYVHEDVHNKSTTDVSLCDRNRVMSMDVSNETIMLNGLSTCQYTPTYIPINIDNVSWIQVI